MPKQYAPFGQNTVFTYKLSSLNGQNDFCIPKNSEKSAQSNDIKVLATT